MKLKFFIVTTIPASLSFFKGQLSFLDQVFTICAISSQKERLELFGLSEKVRTYYIPMVRPISLFKDWMSLFWFIRFFLKEKPEIVHGNTPKASFLSMVAAKLAGVPVRIYMCHGLRYQGYQGIMKKLLMFMEKISCVCATEVLCVSTGVRKTLITDKICHQNKCKVVHYGSANGINLELFDSKKVNCLKLREEIGIPEKDFVYLFVGRIVKDKGINELIGAFDGLSKVQTNVSLLLVGTEERLLDPISEKSSRIIKLNPKIFAIGQREDVKPYMAISDVFVLPSYREGFGMVLIEAGAMGLPCIVTDINGCNEIIIPNDNGIIIPPRDVDALYKAMEYCLNHPDEVKRMAANARPLIASRYDQKMVWKALLKEYQRILNDR